MFKQSRGVTLLELLLVIGLGSFVTLSEIQNAAIDQEQIRTKQMAKEIIEYNNAVLTHISFFAGQVTSSSTPEQLQGTKNGVRWLQSSTVCSDGQNSSPNNFLRCDYLDYNNELLGFSYLSFTTYFETIYDSATDSASVEAITVLSDKRSSTQGTPWTLGGRTAYGLSGLAALTVNSSPNHGTGFTGTSSSAEAVFCSTSGTRRDICQSSALPSPTIAREKILLRASNISSNSDIFLRVDGSNTMNNDLTFNDSLPYNNREIKNISRLLGRSGQGIVLGNGGSYGSSTPSNGLVVVNANEEIYGSFTVNGNAQINGTLNATGNIRSNADVRADDDLIAGDDLTVGDSATIGSNITVGNRVTSNDILTRILYDRDNSSFYVDPSSTSITNRLRANSLTNQGSGNLLISTNSNGNSSGNPNGGQILVQSNSELDLTADTVVDINAADSIIMDAANDFYAEANDRVDIRAFNNAYIEGQDFYQIGTTRSTSGSLSHLRGNRTSMVLEGNDAITTFSDADTTINSGRDTRLISSRYNFLSAGTYNHFRAPSNYLDSDIANTFVKSNGSYVSIKNLLPTWSHQSTWIADDNQTVTKPSCASGFVQSIIAVPMVIATYSDFDSQAGRWRHSWTVRAQSSGNSWIIRVEARDDYANDRTRGRAVVMTYCVKT